MKPASERIASYTARIARAKQWQAFYKENAGQQDQANYQHWLDVEADLKQRLYEANLELELQK